MASVECLIGEMFQRIINEFLPPARFSLPSQPLHAGGQRQERKRAMTYGLSTRAFIEDGPAVQAIRTRSSYSTARSWRALSAERRIALIEQALEPANDRIDAYPLAL
jgi:hypothetical protein